MVEVIAMEVRGGMRKVFALVYLLFPHARTIPLGLPGIAEPRIDA